MTKDLRNALDKVLMLWEQENGYKGAHPLYPRYLDTLIGIVTDMSAECACAFIDELDRSETEAITEGVQSIIEAFPETEDKFKRIARERDIAYLQEELDILEKLKAKA